MGNKGTKIDKFIKSIYNPIKIVYYKKFNIIKSDSMANASEKKFLKLLF